MFAQALPFPTEIPDSAVTSAAGAAIFVMIVFLGVMYWVLSMHAKTLETLGDKFAEAIKDQTVRMQAIDDSKTAHMVRTAEALAELKSQIRESFDKLNAQIVQLGREVEILQSK